MVLIHIDPETEQFVRYPEHFKGQAVYMVHNQGKCVMGCHQSWPHKIQPETGSISIYTTKHG